MSKVIEYILATSDTGTGLCDIVNEAIHTGGWQPLGGVSVTKHGYYQALVKYEDEETLTMQFDENRKFTGLVDFE